MGKTQKTIFSILAGLAVAALIAIIITWHWGNYRERLRAMRSASRSREVFVDTRATDTAEQLSQLAESRSEKGYAQEALRLADYSVDAAFAAALQDATENPAPVTPETREINERLKAAGAAVTADQNRIALLTLQLSKARANTKDSVQQQLDLAQAQLEIDQDDLDDAHQDLIRAGGDRQASIQRLLDEHEASQKGAAAQAAASSASNAAPSIELTRSDSVVDQAQAWFSLNSKQKLLRQAQQNAFDRQSTLAVAHDALNKTLSDERAQKKILPKKPRVTVKLLYTPGGKGSNAPTASTESAGANATTGTADASATDGASAPGTVATGSADSNGPVSTLSFLKGLTADQKNLTLLDKRIQNEQELATLYGNWISYVKVRKQAFLHGVFVATFWILVIALLVFGANLFVQRFFSDLSPERRALQKLQAIVLFGVEALGIVLILLVIFGMPNNFATVLALAGAGLTVALKDFIVGFFGWFVLMGKDGIRPGDWVEINGVAGEVLEVGLFRTVLLETGNWADAADPTGRKVTFVNSFAIEGHYFNFSTSGQWLWDELEVQAPPDGDPYKVAEAIQKIASDDTSANAQLAETEWKRVAPAYATRTFSAAPSVSVRPEGGAVRVIVRYLTRASERREVRARLYRSVIDLLRQKSPGEVPPPAAVATPPVPKAK